MIDSVNFYLNSAYIGDYTPTVNALTDVKATKTEAGYYTSGKCGNYTVYLRETGVSICGGSLCKYYLGDNMQMLDRHSTREAINALSDTLHLNLPEATVTRLEWGANIVMRHPFASYSKQLQGMQNAERFEQPNTVYYYKKGNKEVFALYDKNTEAKQHKESVHGFFAEANIIRLECRVKRSVKTVLQERELTGATLYSATMYPKLAQRWKETFLSIETEKHTYSQTIASMTGLKEMKDFATFTLIKECGGIDAFTKLIKANKAVGLDKITAMRMRNYAKEVYQTHSATAEQDEAIEELIRKVKAFARLAR